jgi:hypothetical protein
LDVGTHSILRDFLNSVRSEATSHIRKKDEGRRVSGEGHLLVLTLIDDGVGEAKDELHTEDEGNDGHDPESYHQTSVVFVLNAQQDQRQDNIPEEILEDMNEFDPTPLLLKLRILVLLIVAALGAPRDVVHAAEGVDVQDDQIGRSIEEERDSPKAHLHQKLELFMHDGVQHHRQNVQSHHRNYSVSQHFCYSVGIDSFGNLYKLLL